MPQLEKTFAATKTENSKKKKKIFLIHAIKHTNRKLHVRYITMVVHGKGWGERNTQ